MKSGSIRRLAATSLFVTGVMAAQSASALSWLIDSSNSTSNQGLTYLLTGTESDSDTWSFALTISGVNVVGTDTVMGRTFLQDLSWSMPLSYVSAALPGATTLLGGLNASGCSGAGASSFCFNDVHVAAVDGMTVNFTIDAPTASFAGWVPHLKVDWIGSRNNYDLVSDDMVAVTAVPEPETYALMLAGLGFVGFVARRRKARG